MRSIACAALFVFTLEQPPAAAQVPPQVSGVLGVIGGSITTQQSTPLAGVDIKIVDAVGRIVADAVSDAEGRFRVANLTAGPYRLVAALDGFETVTESVVVTLNTAALVTIDLPIARFADTIDVVGETTAIASGQTLAPSKPSRAASSISSFQARAFRAPSVCSRTSSRCRAELSVLRAAGHSKPAFSWVRRR
jgi:hypothetical protein